MEDAQAVQAHLALSRQFLATAKDALGEGRLGPARFNLLHALELAVKAALEAAGETHPTHNVGGSFGRHYRARVDPEVLRRVNRMLDSYREGRYPDDDMPSGTEIAEDLDFVARFVTTTVPSILGP